MNLTVGKTAVRMPDFLVVGAAKAGTSALCVEMSKHPCVFLSTPKEPNFFLFDGDPGLYDRRRPLYEAAGMNRYGLDAYCALFADAGSEQKLGEGSTAYLNYPEPVIESIGHRYGDRKQDLRIVMVLRDPAERAFSHYLMYRKWGIENRDFRTAIGMGPSTSSGSLERQIDYLSPGYYAQHVRQYLDAFSHVHVFLYEDLGSDGVVLPQLFDDMGLNVADAASTVSERVHMGGVPRAEWVRRLSGAVEGDGIAKRAIRRIAPPGLRSKAKSLISSEIQSRFYHRPKLDQESRGYLIEKYHDDIVCLENLIGRTLSDWRRVEQ